MGAELSAAAEPDRASRRRLRIRCHGAAPLASIDVIRNNRLVHSVSPGDALDCEAEWEDGEPLEDIWLPPAAFCTTPFCFYYVRVLQADGEMAWASPVWIGP